MLNTQARSIRVGIIDPNQQTRKGLAFLVNGTGGMLLTCDFANAEQALQGISNHEPQVLIFSLGSLDKTGFQPPTPVNDPSSWQLELEQVRSLKRQCPSLDIILMADHEYEDLIFQAFEAGAGGFLHTEVSPLRLLEAIREIHEGGAPLTPKAARILVYSFHRNQQSKLSTRELQVLQLMAKGKSYTAIAEVLFVDKETVRTHIKNIYVKLGVHSKADALDLAYRERII
jgi:DNA-binding NarL/FixJ family response regulator